MRCTADRLAAYFAEVSELSLVVSDECAAVVTSVPGFDSLTADEQDTAVDLAFRVPCRVSLDEYGPDAWGRTVVRLEKTHHAHTLAAFSHISAIVVPGASTIGSRTSQLCVGLYMH